MTIRFASVSAAFLFSVLAIASIRAGDFNLLQAVTVYSAHHPVIARSAVALTQLGSGPFLLTMIVLTAVFLWTRSRPDLAVFALATAIGGRLAVELLKAIVERPRPELLPYPVHVSSWSFPSGHAANSMITFLVIVVTAVPARRRPPALAIAIGASLAIGLTRPLLGVHWPSDVLAGWAFGIFWVLACIALSGRAAEQQHKVV